MCSNNKLDVPDSLVPCLFAQSGDFPAAWPCMAVASSPLSDHHSALILIR